MKFLLFLIPVILLFYFTGEYAWIPIINILGIGLFWYNKYFPFERSKIDPVFFLVLFALIENLSHFLSCIYIEDSSASYWIYGIKQYAPKALLISSFGFIALIAGFNNWRNNVIVPVAVSLRPASFDAFFVFVLLLVFLQSFVSLSGLGALDFILFRVPLFVVFFFSFLGKQQGNKRLHYYSLTLTILFTVQNFLHAYLRSDIILPVILFFLGMLLGSNNLKKFLIQNAVPLIVLIIVFSTFFSVFGKKRESFSSGTSRIEQLVQGKEDAEYYLEQETEFGMLQRIGNLNQLTSVVDLVNKRGFYGGETLAYLAYVFIPRFIWPDKPMIASGRWFALETGNANGADITAANNSINMTVPGEFYLNFGFFGVFIGTFFFGIFLKILWLSAEMWSVPNNITGFIWGGYLMTAGGADLQIAVTMISIYLLLLGFTFVLGLLGYVKKIA